MMKVETRKIKMYINNLRAERAALYVRGWERKIVNSVNLFRRQSVRIIIFYFISMRILFEVCFLAPRRSRPEQTFSSNRERGEMSEIILCRKLVFFFTARRKFSDFKYQQAESIK